MEKIYSKTSNNYKDKFFSSIKNYNNNILLDLLNNSFDDDKNIMVSELDINLNKLQIENINKIETYKNIKNTGNNNNSKLEFKNELRDNILKFLQNKNNKSFNKKLNNKTKRNTISNTKTSINFALLTPSNECFRTINDNKNNEGKINKRNCFIKINKEQINNKKSIIDKNIKNKEFIFKKIKNKYYTQSIFNKLNNNKIYKKIKSNKSHFSHPKKGLLNTEIKRVKNIPNINENIKINHSNIKNSKNTFFLKDIIKQSNSTRNSFKNSTIKNTFKNLKKFKILNSISKPNEIKKNTINKKLITLSSIRFSFIDNHNKTKNISHEKHENNHKLFIKRTIPSKFRNLTLKEINMFNSNLNSTRSNCSSSINNTSYIKEKEKNYTNYDKNKLKSLLNKKEPKIHIKKNLENILNKKPINIVNININRNNNFIMNINNNEYDNKKNSSKNKRKIRKFFSFQNNLKLGDSYKKEIFKKGSKDKKIINKEKKIISLINKTEKNKIYFQINENKSK